MATIIPLDKIFKRQRRTKRMNTTPAPAVTNTAPSAPAAQRNVPRAVPSEAPDAKIDKVLDRVSNLYSALDDLNEALGRKIEQINDVVDDSFDLADAITKKLDQL